MSKPLCFVCGREPIDNDDEEDFVETDDGYICPGCSGDVEDDTSDIINQGQIWPLSDDSEGSDDNHRD